MQDSGLAQKTSEAHKNSSQLPNLSQSSAEVKFDGRDKNDVAMSSKNQSLVSSMLLGQTLLATASIFICPGKI